MLTRSHASGNPGGGPDIDCTMLDAGVIALDVRDLRRWITAILDGAVDEMARDRNAICYRVPLTGADGTLVAAVVKVPRPGPQRTNADATFGGEARILALLPAAGIRSAPALLGRAVAADRHFLIMADLPGAHPDARRNPLDARELTAILDHLHAMDARGLMHYDLKSANILLDGDRAYFVDFEFARFRDRADTWSPSGATYCEDFNVSGNPWFPMRSNVANFEFRALHRYLDDLAAFDAAAAPRVLYSWLRAKSGHHRRMQARFRDWPAPDVSRMAEAGALTPDMVRERLRAASAHEAALADLFARPPDAVTEIERALMAYRCAIFERQPEDAARLRDRLLDAVRSHPAATSLPSAYREAVERIVDLAARSVHPDA